MSLRVVRWLLVGGIAVLLWITGYAQVGVEPGGQPGPELPGVPPWLPPDTDSGPIPPGPPPETQDLIQRLPRRDQERATTLQRSLQELLQKRSALRSRRGEMSQREKDLQGFLRDHEAELGQATAARKKADQDLKVAQAAHRQAQEKADSLKRALETARKKVEIGKQALEATRPGLSPSNEQLTGFERAQKYYWEALGEAHRLEEEVARSGAARDKAAGDLHKTIGDLRRAKSDEDDAQIARDADRAELQFEQERAARLDRRLAQLDREIGLCELDWSQIQRQAAWFRDLRERLRSVQEKELTELKDITYWSGELSTRLQTFGRFRQAYEARGVPLAGMSRLFSVIGLTNTWLGYRAGTAVDPTWALSLGGQALGLVQGMFLPPLEQMPVAQDGYYDLDRIAMHHMYELAEAANSVKEASDRLQQAREAYRRTHITRTTCEALLRDKN